MIVTSEHLREYLPKGDDLLRERFSPKTIRKLEYWAIQYQGPSNSIVDELFLKHQHDGVSLAKIAKESELSIPTIEKIFEAYTLPKLTAEEANTNQNDDPLRKKQSTGTRRMLKEIKKRKGNYRPRYERLGNENQEIFNHYVRQYGIIRFIEDISQSSQYNITSHGSMTRANIHRIMTGIGGVSPTLAQATYEFFGRPPELSFLEPIADNPRHKIRKKRATPNTQKPIRRLGEAYAVVFDATVQEIRTNYSQLPSDKKREVIGLLEMILEETKQNS